MKGIQSSFYQILTTEDLKLLVKLLEEQTCEINREASKKEEGNTIAD